MIYRSIYVSTQYPTNEFWEIADGWSRGPKRTDRRNVTKRNVTGWQPVHWRHGLCLNCECADVEARVRQIRNGCDACTRPPAPCSRPHNIPLSLPLSHARARNRLSPSPTAFISHHAPHHGQAGSFLSAQGSVHACTWILREIKGNRFAHSKKRERFPKFTGR